MELICKSCGNKYNYEEKLDRYECICGSPLWLDFNPLFCKEDIRKEDFSIWRYDKAFPFKKDEHTISFQEGLTPLSRSMFRNKEILIKMDSLLPTGSFKDRGTAMVINELKRLGVKNITEDSSGNAAASVAAYCAKSGIKCNIFVPLGTSEGKLIQAKKYGANIYEIPGSRDDVEIAARKGLEGSTYAGHNWHPYFIQGTKSVAYEIWEQMGYKAPDHVVCSVGNGSTLIGMYLGFQELFNSNEIQKVPKLHGVQSENCNTVYRIYKGLSEDYLVKPTIAEGIALYKPSRRYEILICVKETNGTMVSVPENEIIDSFNEMASAGFYMEPTSATAFAGLGQIFKNEIISKEESVVITLSGMGLKATDKIKKLM